MRRSSVNRLVVVYHRITWGRRPVCRCDLFSSSRSADAVVLDAIRALTAIEDRRPKFAGAWTPDSIDYRREIALAPNGLACDDSGTCVPEPFLLVADDVSKLTGQLKDLTKSGHPLLNLATNYFFDMDTGKKIRATMVLLTAKACCGFVTDKQRHLAEIIEMIHTASLFHDDVIDNADSRRGLASTNAKFGDKVAILAGDFLLARACIALSRLQNLDVIELISMVIEHLVKGEIIQMRPGTLHASQVKSTPLEVYLHKSFYKTSSLMANACRASAMLENADRSMCDAVFKFGRHVGLAFQLVDDVLDFEGTENALGKPTLSDLRSGLLTAPTLLAAEEQPQLAQIIARGFSEPSDVDVAIDLVKSSQGIRRTKDLAIVQTEYAADALRILPCSNARDALSTLASTIVTRTC